MRGWTLGRAVGVAATLGLVALLLWPVFDIHPVLFWVFVAAACLAGLCGAWIVVATMLDLTFHRPRGERLRPVRAFDLVLGGSLFLLALLQLRDAVGQLPA
jgi:hypothetical protein